MPELSDVEREAITDVKAAIFLIMEKLRAGTALSEEIRSTYNAIAGNTEFLKRYVSQIDKLKDDISEAASEIISEEVAQLWKAYEIMQNDYNTRMNRISKIFYASVAANIVILVGIMIDFFFRH